jgi:hypothetical protein
MTDAINPALTPEEWAAIPAGPWAIEFNSYGGYDSLSSAYHVIAPDEPGHFAYIVDVDTGAFHDGGESYEQEHGPNARAEAVAKLIVAARNTALGFTWDDVDLLRRVEANDEGSGGSDIGMLPDLADRIAALLPPR